MGIGRISKATSARVHLVRDIIYTWKNSIFIQWMTTKPHNLVINQVHDLEEFLFDIWTLHISGFKEFTV